MRSAVPIIVKMPRMAVGRVRTVMSVLDGSRDYTGFGLKEGGDGIKT